MFKYKMKISRTNITEKKSTHWTSQTILGVGTTSTGVLVYWGDHRGYYKGATGGTTGALLGVLPGHYRGYYWMSYQGSTGGTAWGTTGVVRFPNPL